jgi:UDP-N-acetylglucosamine 1-carboxyvinyltransferase
MDISSPDIRTGISLLLAALSAEGRSIINKFSVIKRGYGNIVERLKILGADIEEE